MAGFCTGSVTFITDFLQVQIKFLLAAENRLFKCDTHAGTHVGAPHRPIACASAASSSAEQITEDVAENIAHIRAAEVKAAESSGAACRTVKGRMTKLIILSSLFRIA